MGKKAPGTRHQLPAGEPVRREEPGVGARGPLPEMRCWCGRPSVVETVRAVRFGKRRYRCCSQGHRFVTLERWKVGSASELDGVEKLW